MGSGIGGRTPGFFVWLMLGCLVLFPKFGYAVVVTPPSPNIAASVCADANVSPWSQGVTPSAPGAWGNRLRDGEGWDLIYSSDPTSGNKLKVVLYTYDTHGHPVWLATQMLGVPDGASTWSATLYKYTSSNLSGSSVGSVAFRYMPDDFSRIAITYYWDEFQNVGSGNPGPQTECIGSSGTASPNPTPAQNLPAPNGSTLPSYGGVRANQLFSGYWNTTGQEDGVPGFSLHVIETNPVNAPVGSFVEANTLLTFDDVGEPVWLFGDFGTNCGAGVPGGACVPPPLQASGVWKYVTPKVPGTNPNDPHGYPYGIPLQDCQVENITNYCTNRVDVGSATRAIADQTGVQLSFTSTINVTHPQTQNPFPPGTLQVLNALHFGGGNVATTLKKTTESTGIAPVQHVCQVATINDYCTIYVPWNDTHSIATPWRHDLNIGTYTQLNTAVTGEVFDPLPAGSRVDYELWSGDPTVNPGGRPKDQSAEVRVYGPTTTQVGDATDGPAQAPTLPATFTAPAAPSAAADSVGAIAAKFRVDESGNANYRIPLVVPQGAGGFEPQLALTYSSGGGMGYFGTGFSLEGSSAILPCRPNAEFGDTDIPTAVASVFCLDGQRLLLQSNTDRTVGAVYRTEIETFQKVVIESIVSVAGADTFTFAVYGKDGTVRHFGGAAGTVVSAASIAGQPPVPTAWLEYEAKDVSGNTITFNYSAASTSGERLLNNITYSGGQIVFGYNAGGGIDSTYANVLAIANKPQPQARMGHMQRSQLVTSINVSSSEGFLRHYVLCYQDPFATGTCSPTVYPQVRARLTTIKECADALGTTCYAPTTMDWSDPDSTPLSSQNGTSNTFLNLASYKLGDFDGDHRSDVLWIDGGNHLWVSYARTTSSGGLDFSVRTSVTILSPTFDSSMLWEVFDYNGDGLDDVLYASVSGTTLQWNVILAQIDANGNPSFAPSQLLIANGGTVSTLPQGFLGGSSMLADFDGDGLPDLMWTGPGDTEYHIASMIANPGGNIPTADHPYAFGSVSSVVFTGSDGVTVCPLASAGLTREDAAHSEAIDIDGDGRADTHFVLVAGNPGDPCFSNQTSVPTAPIEPPPSGSAVPPVPSGTLNSYILKTFRSQGILADGKFHFGMYAWLNVNVPLITDTFDATTAATRFRFVDLNGDGLVDLVARFDDGPWRYAVTGSDGTFHCIDGCALTSTSDGNASLVQDKQVQLIDYDGDGKADFWYPANHSGTGNYNAYLWHGNGFDSFQTTPHNAQAGPTWSPVTADFDGDGMPEVMVVRPSDGHWYASRTSSHHKPRGLVTSFSNGLLATAGTAVANTTQITYSPLTFSSVYTRDFNAPFLHRPVLNYGRDSVIFDSVNPTYVVQYVESSAPTNGIPGDTAIMQYFYAGQKFQAGGRGSLGFRQVSSFDHQTDMEVDTTYSQQYPINGVPTQTQTSYVPSFPADPCLAAGGADAPGCMVRTPFCVSLNVLYSNPCIAPLPAGSQAMKAITDTWNWRVQPNALSNANLTMIGTNVVPPAASPSTSIRANLFIARVGSTTKNYDFGTGIVTQDVTSFDPAQFDDVGNPLQSTTTKTGGGVTLSANSNFIYSNDVANWKLSRLLTSTVVNQRTDSSGSKMTARRSTFGYDDNINTPPDTRKLLRSEKVEGLLANLNVDTTVGTTISYYDYDGWGNRKATYTCSASGVTEGACRGLTGYDFHPHGPNGLAARGGIMRYTKTSFDASTGRFPDAIREGFYSANGPVEQPVQQVTARSNGGDPKTVVDANGVVTQILYSAFGRKYYEWNSTGAYKRYDYAYCTSSNCPSSRALSYVVKTTTAGGPASQTYYDVVGRARITSTQGFAAADAISTLVDYDNHGRVAYKSQPFMAVNTASGSATAIAGAGIYWTHTEYDGLDRPGPITNPDGGKIDVDYNGLSTTTTLPLNNAAGKKSTQIRQTITKVKDPGGNVVSSTDANNLTLTYGYDAVGNLTSIMNGSVTRMTSTYDSLGRKLTLSDPDFGTTKSYMVDDLGETIQQSSALNCTQMLWDARGRMWERVDYPNTTCTGTADTVSQWEFDRASYGYGKLDQESTVANGQQKVLRTFAYTGYSQPSMTTTLIDADTYTDQTNYDQYGRLFQTFFGAPNLPMTGELYEYNAQGYQEDFRSAYPGTSGIMYYQANAMDAYGHVTQEYRSSNAVMLTERAYDPETGRLTGIQTGGGYTQNLAYAYDKVGNMVTRADQTGSMNYDQGRDVLEQFSYDGLQRLTSTTVSIGALPPATFPVSYDNDGNISSKGNPVANYSYGLSPAASGCSGSITPGPHAVSKAGGVRYCYDANGNVVSGGAASNTITYSTYDLPTTIITAVNPTKVGFDYGPNREKLRRLNYTQPSQVTAQEVTHYVGSAEVHYMYQGGALSEVRRYLGPLLVVQSRTGNLPNLVYQVQREYFLTDAQGSTFAVLNDWGEPLNDHASMSFDAFGARRDPESTTVLPWNTGLQADIEAATRHGYTGHEQIDVAGIIHMRGRIYDPTLGRFLQPDPFVQDPYNSQSLNRFSYVMNNPMSSTDPTGYFGFGDLMRDVMIGVAAYVTGGLAVEVGGLTGAAIAFTGGFAIGGVQTGSARGALQGGLTSAVFYGVDDFIKVPTKVDFSDTKFLQAYAERALASGIAGGVLAPMMGQRFGNGFVSAGLSSALSPVAGMVTSDPTGQGLVETIIGGTTSKLSGGSFANGAVTAAFQFAFGKVPHQQAGSASGMDQTIENDAYARLGGYFDGSYYAQLRPVMDDAAIRSQMEDAWSNSNPLGPYESRSENGFWITEHAYSGLYDTQPFYSSNGPSHMTPGPVPLMFDGDAIGTFHTHTGTIDEGFVQWESTGDVNFSNKIGLPGIIKSWSGFFIYGPTKPPYAPYR